MEKFAFRLGQIVQGLGLGLLLFAALTMMVQIESGARVFRYQGF